MRNPFRFAAFPLVLLLGAVPAAAGGVLSGISRETREIVREAGPADVVVRIDARESRVARITIITE